MACLNLCDFTYLTKEQWTSWYNVLVSYPYIKVYTNYHSDYVIYLNKNKVRQEYRKRFGKVPKGLDITDLILKMHDNVHKILEIRKSNFYVLWM